MTTSAINHSSLERSPLSRWFSLLWARFFIMIYRLVERLEDMRNSKNIEATEKDSTVLAFCCSAAIALVHLFYPHGLYLAWLQNHIGYLPASLFFLAFATLSTIGVLFGVEPSGFIWTERHKAIWREYRRAMLLLGMGFWFIVSVFFLIGAVYIIGLYGLYKSGTCFYAAVQMTYKEKQAGYERTEQQAREQLRASP